MANKILYSKAHNENNEIVDIKDFTKNNKSGQGGKFKCISCNQEIIPRLGDHNQWHFAHKSITPNCNSETYLHKSAKLLLYNNLKFRIDNGLSFYFKSMKVILCNPCHLNKSYKCKIGEEELKSDILKKYLSVDIETSDHGFIPDILLKSPQGNLWIEIFVTHKISNLKKSSNVKIVQIEISKENDLQLLENDFLDLLAPNIKTFNIKIPPNYRVINPDECPKKLEKKLINNNTSFSPQLSTYAYINECGEICYKGFSRREISIIKSDIKYKYLQPFNPKKHYGIQLEKYVEAADKAGITPIFSCYLCKNSKKIFVEDYMSNRKIFSKVICTLHHGRIIANKDMIDHLYALSCPDYEKKVALK